ncbi:cupin [Nonomuraea sp. ATR24]|uniref:cupin n=1 Tax=Nonomuraea sp. ATR24 TaxID=1676744 RepID=UPI0035C0862E
MDPDSPPPRPDGRQARSGPTITPIDLYASAVHLGQGGEIHTGDPDADPGRDWWRLTATYARSGDDRLGRWTVHPEAETVVSCLIGKIRLYVRPERPGECEEVVRLVAGTAAIVPRGRRHRVEPDIPSDVLTVTLPHGSLWENQTGPVAKG